MRREYIFIWYLTCFLLLDFKSLYINAEESGNEYSKGCAHLRCENGSHCVKRRFWCKDPPCPGMLYCSKSRKETLKGPSTCDTVRCSRGHICVLRVRGCTWNRKCKQQIARCISEKEYYEGPASCVGFKCPLEKRCILREAYCFNPPCKLIRSCAEIEDVQIWFDECRNLNCTSEYECFLRRPKNNCIGPWCAHTPDCTFTLEDEIISKYCYGWICPQEQKCIARIVGSCKGFNCTIERSCRVSSTSSAKHDIYMNDEVAEQPLGRKTLQQIEKELIHQELENKMNTQMNYPSTVEKPTVSVTSTQRQSIQYTTPKKNGTKISHQQSTTTKSNLITKPMVSLTTEPYLTLTQSWLNQNKLSTTNFIDEGNVFKTTSEFSNSLKNLTFPTTLSADERIESTTLRDTKRLEVLNNIYIATNNALPLFMLLKNINFVRQDYPFWIKNEPYYLAPLQTKKEVISEWRYGTPQQPYRILLPPYEPVILVDNARTRGQSFPFLINSVFDQSFNKAALVSLPKITSGDTTGNSKINNILTTMNDNIDNYINDSTIVELENFKTNNFDDSFDNYKNFPAMGKTNSISLNIRDKELDNYYVDYESGQWYVTHDYLEQNELQSAHEQEFESSIELATDDLYGNDMFDDITTTIRNQFMDEKRNQDSETQYVDSRNKNLTTFNPFISTGQSDYSSRDKEHHGLANYPSDTIPIHDLNKSKREDEGSVLDKILDISLSEEENQRNIPTTFLYDEFDRQENERPITTYPYEGLSYHSSNNDEKNKEKQGVRRILQSREL